MFIVTVPAGFPSPAAHYAEGPLDLNHHLNPRPAATFFVRVSGDSMIGAGIHSGDLLIVDRSVMPKHGNVVIAVLNGELTVKRLQKEGCHLALVPANPDYPIIEIAEGMDFEVWGVVTKAIHYLH